MNSERKMLMGCKAGDEKRLGRKKRAIGGKNRLKSCRKKVSGKRGNEERDGSS